MKEMSDSWQSLIRYAKTIKSKASTLKATLKKQDTLLKHQFVDINRLYGEASLTLSNYNNTRNEIVVKNMDLLRNVTELDYSNIVMSKIKSTLRETMMVSDWIHLEQGEDSDHVSRLDSTHMMISRGTFTKEKVGVNALVFLAQFEKTQFNGGGHDQVIEPFKSSTMLEYVKNRYSHDVAQIMSLPDQGLDQST